MNSRTKKSARNVNAMTISRVMNLLLNFISRTFFIRFLGTEYLGINGLFTNILTILSFAELGIGNAIIFKLYKPVAEENKEKVKTLLMFYKKVYFTIGIIVFVIGICILPFINLFVNSNVEIRENLNLLYFLFLTNTAVSYFFTYKRSIIIANQDEYVISIIELITNVISCIVKIILLFLTKNYILYLLITIIFTIIGNIIVARKANKKYPYITEKEYKIITKKEKKNIFNDVKSIILYKIGFVLSNGTDNIIISKALGVTEVGLLSNYTIITTGLNSLMSSAFNSLTGSIGNLNTIKESEKKEQVFYEILYLSFILYSVVSICIILLSNEFISIWLGEKYLLSYSICFALGFDMYIDGMRFANYSFRNTSGLFKKGRMLPLASSVINVILSIVLVNYMGMFGVLIATGLTRLFILSIYDPYLLHKNIFHSSSKKYYIKYVYYLIISFIGLIAGYLINIKITTVGIFGFIIHGVIDVIVIIIIILVFTFKSEEFKNIKKRFILDRRKKYV